MDLLFHLHIHWLTLVCALTGDGASRLSTLRLSQTVLPPTELPRQGYGWKPLGPDL